MKNTPQDHDIEIDPGNKWAYFCSYWKNPSAWLYSFFIIAGVVGIVTCSYLINQWIGDFFTFLQAYNQTAFFNSIIHVIILSSIVLVSSIVMHYAVGKMRISMQEYYTRKFHHYNKDKTVDNRLQYIKIKSATPFCKDQILKSQEQTSLKATNRKKVDSLNFLAEFSNPKQTSNANPIAYNIPALTGHVVKLPELLVNIGRTIVFGFIVYQLAPIASNTLFQLNTSLPKPMFFGLIAYSVLSVTILFWITNKFAKDVERVKDNINQSADSMVKHADEANASAHTLDLHHGIRDKNKRNRESLKTSLHQLLTSFISLKTGTLFSSLIIALLPWVATGYLYFHHIIGLAIMMQLSIAAANYLQSLMSSIDGFGAVAKIAANLTLVANLDAKYRACTSDAFEKHCLKTSPVQISEDIALTLNKIAILRSSQINTTSSEPVFLEQTRAQGFNIEYGKVYELKGPNGIGKSTVIDVILGECPYAVKGGQVFINQDNKKTYRVSQRITGYLKSYIEPINNYIKDNKQYQNSAVWQSLLNEYQNICNNSNNNTGRNLVNADLIESLSPGQRKILAALRVIAMINDTKSIIFLDEINAGVDNKFNLLQIIHTHCPNAAIVFVSHQTRPKRATAQETKTFSRIQARGGQRTVDTEDPPPIVSKHLIKQTGLSIAPFHLKPSFRNNQDRGRSLSI